MFRFSIRELMIAVFVVATLFAWMTERSRLEAALAAAKESKEQARIAGDEARRWQQMHRRLAGERSQIEKELAVHRIEVLWSPSGNACLATRDNKRDLASFHIVSEPDAR
jgi:hypothetical protein